MEFCLLKKEPSKTVDVIAGPEISHFPLMHRESSSVLKKWKRLGEIILFQDNTAFLSAIGGSLGLFLGFSCWESALAAERGASRLCRGLGSWIKRLFERGGEREALDTEGLYRYCFFFCDKGGKWRVFAEGRSLLAAAPPSPLMPDSVRVNEHLRLFLWLLMCVFPPCIRRTWMCSMWLWLEMQDLRLCFLWAL